MRRPSDSETSQLHAMDHMREGVQILDPDLRYLYVNPAAAGHGQREDLVGLTITEAYPGVEATEMFQRLTRCLREGVADEMLNLFTFPDGSSRWFELRMQPVPDGVMILSIDVDQRKRLEEQLAHAQRMEAVGRLAGGIAHDFNNLLTIIQSYASFLEAQLPDDGSRQDVRHILGASERGAVLTGQLMAISRRHPAQAVMVDVDASLQALEPMLGRMVGDRVAVSLVCACPGQVRVGAGQLDQVLLNLAANARDAMVDGGKLVVRTDQVRIHQEYVDSHLNVRPGVYARISVTDTGVGMPSEVQASIFEPFFTTKGPDRGTGLGLATSHGIVKQAGGDIWVYSEPGNGTTFKIYLPLAEASHGDADGTRQAPLTARGGTETLLVVDDDPGMLRLCVRILSDLGYTVLSAGTPTDAVQCAERYAGRIDAVVTDLMMPGLSGPELAALLRARRPGLPALYMSGLIDPTRVGVHTTSIEKPFMPEELARKVREVLQP